MCVLHVLPIAVALTSMALPLSAAPSQKDSPDSLREYKTVSRFLRAVDEYMVVHRLVGPLEPENLCLPDEAYASVRSLAAVPLDARPAPHEGDIFLPDVADLFRDRIARTLRHSEYHPPDFMAQMNVEELTAPPIAVNKPLPWGAGRWRFTWLLATLPALPEDLEYRLVGRNLALVDVRANIVVDVLRGAVPLY
jgi:hypothetical protein